MESNRQKKIGTLLQKDLVDVLQKAAKDGGLNGVLISVSKVAVTADLSIAKVYISVFPSKNADTLLEGIRSNTPLIRHELAARTKHQLRRMPNLKFYLDDTLDYLDGIHKSLKGEENPIKDESLLDTRKKS